MDIERLCPLSADAFTWQPSPGEYRLSVCVKATFALLNGRTAELASPQIPLHDDILWNAQQPSSLYAPNDYVPRKQRIDILLTGHAHSAAGTPVTSLAVRLGVGTFTKSLRITGDRVWTPAREGLRPSSPRPFVSMPLRYERAAFGTANPMGIDVSPNNALAGRLLPNIQLLDENMGQMGVPGFGPIPASARARSLRLGDAARSFAHHFRTDKNPPGKDFDFAFFNAAPFDQQVDSLPEPLDIVLENLHPGAARFSSRLPPIRPRAFHVSPKTGFSYAIPLLLDTVLIDSDRSLSILSFRGNIAVPTANERALGKVVITTTEAMLAAAEDASDTLEMQPLPPPKAVDQRPSPRAGAQAKPANRGTVPMPPAPSFTENPRAQAAVGESTIVTRENPIASLINSNALPKGWAAPPAPASPTAPIPPAEAPQLVNTNKLQSNSSLRKTNLDVGSGTALDSPAHLKELSRGLPFVSANTPKAQPAQYPPPPVDPDEVGSTTLAAPGPPQPAVNILPFGKPLSASAPLTQPPLRPAEPSGTLPLGMRSPPSLMSGLPFQTPPESPPPPPAFSPPPAPVPPPRSSTPGYTAPPLPVPPPRASQPAYAAPAPESSRPPPSPAPPPAIVKSAAPAVSVEQCAAVAAELGARFSPRADVLRKHHLSEAVFGDAERHWMNAIAAESEAGKSDLLDGFDDCYVKALEQLRGELTIETYAKLMVGSERGNLRPVLSELRLQRPAVMRIERVWKRRLERDAKLSLAVAEAIAAERKK